MVTAILGKGVVFNTEATWGVNVSYIFSSMGCEKMETFVEKGVWDFGRLTGFETHENRLFAMPLLRV